MINKISYVRDQSNGDLVLNAELTADEREYLYALFNSPGWKIYRQILIKMKEGYQFDLLPKEDPNKILKGLGIVVGLNAAINQLGILIAQFQKQAAAVTGESKNPSQP